MKIEKLSCKILWNSVFEAGVMRMPSRIGCTCRGTTFVRGGFLYFLDTDL